MHRENIDKIMRQGTPAQQAQLRDLFVECVDLLKNVDPDKCKMIKYKISKIANHGHLDEQTARSWVHKMTDKNGISGEHWTMDQVHQFLREKGSNYNANDMYAAMNKMYADHYNSRFDTSVYFDLAKDWLDDREMGEDKALKYYYYMADRSSSNY